MPGSRKGLLLLAVVGFPEVRTVPGSQRELEQAPQSRGFSSEKMECCSLFWEAAFSMAHGWGVLSYATRGRRRPRIFGDGPGLGGCHGKEGLVLHPTQKSCDELPLV